MSSARRRTEERDGLAVDLEPGHQPIERVLEGAGQAMRILRSCDRDARAICDKGAKLDDGQRQAVAVAIGVEGWQTGKPFIKE